ncbi:MAG: hypothetical protein IT364_21965 [Candidatus Hydrogenedentes bacterium]|nr:hypothetical protein [Candidatus Hydrogenedentota bacterium]
MRKRVALCITGLILLAGIGVAPRYLEELRIGGGYGDPVNGGADFENDGDIATNGALTVQGATTLSGDLTISDTDIAGTGTTLGLNPTGAGQLTVSDTTASFSNSSGRLWFYATAGTSSHFRFYLPDSAANTQDFGSLWCFAEDASDGSEDGLFKLALNRNGVYDYDVFSVNSVGNGRFDGDVTAEGGDGVFGTDGNVRGVLTLWEGSGGAAPATLRFHSRNGTAWYLFVEDDGTLRIHNTVPSNNSDGAIVGLQN